ncbi:MAG: hypothetical protein DRG78_01605 [Epsilonproteobacteria bacterium]|nr:MAG: hypothetical protein DRG78_01605 [Campylobacterota bacterium]
MNDNRYEIKFILNESELVEAYYFLKMIGSFSPYPNRSINSLYFDTVDFQCVRDNLAGISQRHKVRLRWYDENNNNNFQHPVLEIKKRNARLGSKSKYIIPNITKKDILNQTANTISNNVFKYIQKNYEYDYLLNEQYIPIICINYNREYYETSDGLRITIDKNINFRNITFNNSITHYNPIPYNEYIMELKFPIEMKNNVANKIRYLNLTPKRHSKYLTGMAKLGYAVYI